MMRSEEGAQRRKERGLDVSLPPLVGVDEIEERPDIVPVLRANFLLACHKARAHLIVPAALAQKLVPNFDLFLAGFPAPFETPFEDIQVRAAFLDALDHVMISDAQKMDTALVETLAEVFMVILRQLRLGVEADLVQHPPEINETTNLVVRTPEIFDFHMPAGCPPIFPFSRTRATPS